MSFLSYHVIQELDHQHYFLEPNSFSFNSPKGACNSCNGLGYFKKVDIRKIIPNDLISINKGAISPISVSKPKWILDQITLLGKKYDFNLNTPIKLISKEGIDAILYGDSDSFVEKLNFAGISKTHKISFEGIVISKIVVGFSQLCQFKNGHQNI